LISSKGSSGLGISIESPPPNVVVILKSGVSRVKLSSVSIGTTVSIIVCVCDSVFVLRQLDNEAFSWRASSIGASTFRGIALEAAVNGMRCLWNFFARADELLSLPGERLNKVEPQIVYLEILYELLFDYSGKVSSEDSRS
jgi:hypothetical protein